MKKYRFLSYIFFKLLFFLIINYFLLNIIGNKYLKKFNLFIENNNKLQIKNAINNLIINSNINIDNNLYNTIYNEKKEIIDLNLNANQINKYLSEYLNTISNLVNNTNYNYLNAYYKHFNSNNNTYYLIPLGMISNNPFIYNMGPKVIISYDYINTISIKIDVSVKNYGLNNALVETCLYVQINQNILKPILKEVSSHNYRFLLSSRLINGRVASYLGTTLNRESESISN